ncbi:MAG: peptidoglycan-binding protein [Bryobacteraceae bacterium]|nr:peptidoglycan-binding protein [Bryobacteraceae bacterium]
MPVIHSVRAGECLASLAAEHGFPDWQAIYFHPGNADLRRRRPNPHILNPGDEILIPDREAGETSCASERRHQFVLREPPVELRLRLEDFEGRTLARREYELEIGHRRYRGVTDSNGQLEEQIPARATGGLLKVHASRDGEALLFFPLALGHLDPETEMAGVQARLQNLGFPCGVSGSWDEATRKALRLFQRKHGLPETGEADEATRQRLAGVHDRR